MEIFLLHTEKEFRNFLFEKGNRLNWITERILSNERVNFSDSEIVKICEYFLDLFLKEKFTEENYWTFYTYLSEAYLREYGGIYKYSKNEIDDIYKNTCITFTKGPIAFMASEFIVKIIETNNPNYYHIRINELKIIRKEFEKFKVEQEERLKKSRK